MTEKFSTRYSTAVLRVPENVIGRDFVVGDIHGCFDQVLEAMAKVAFDRRIDRLFSVGDLIDRGPDSHRSAKFLRNPWIFAVRGNHEDMLLDLYAETDEPHPAIVEYMASRNGFGWWLKTPPEVRREVLAAAATMPIAIEIRTKRGLVGLVHADVPAGMDWETFTAKLEARDMAVAEVALWGRDRVIHGDESGIAGVGRVYCGHTPMKRATKLGNMVCVDTGAVYGFREAEAGALTFADICTGTAVFSTLQSMKRPPGLVNVLAEAETPAQPFSPR